MVDKEFISIQEAIEEFGHYTEWWTERLSNGRIKGKKNGTWTVVRQSILDYVSGKPPTPDNASTTPENTILDGKTIEQWKKSHDERAAELSLEREKVAELEEELGSEKHKADNAEEALRGRKAEIARQAADASFIDAVSYKAAIADFEKAKTNFANEMAKERQEWEKEQKQRVAEVNKRRQEGLDKYREGEGMLVRATQMINDTQEQVAEAKRMKEEVRVESEAYQTETQIYEKRLPDVIDYLTNLSIKFHKRRYNGFGNIGSLIANQIRLIYALTSRKGTDIAECEKHPTDFYSPQIAILNYKQVKKHIHKCSLIINAQMGILQGDDRHASQVLPIIDRLGDIAKEIDNAFVVMPVVEGEVRDPQIVELENENEQLRRIVELGFKNLSIEDADKVIEGDIAGDTAEEDKQEGSDGDVKL